MERLFAKWLGHSTVLLQMGGATILTDPVFSMRIGVALGPFTIGIKRLMPPAVAIESIPKPDLILLSHAHFDHFDIPSLRNLESKNTVVVTASKTSDLLRADRYGAVHELSWGDAVQAGPLKISAFQVKHWGARMQRDRYRGYNGYTIETDGARVIFGGDTAITDSFRQLRTARPWDLGIMPIGAYNPWIHYHCTPEQAWQMGNEAGVERFLPVHHQTFALSREPLLEPIERFQQVAGDRVAVSQLGGEIIV